MAITLPRSPQGLGTTGCDTKYYSHTSFLAENEDLVSRTSLHLGPSANSTALPPIRRRKSAFRVKPGQTRYMVDQAAAEHKKSVHFDNSFEQTRLFLPADAPLALTSKPTPTAGEATSKEPARGSPFQLGRERRFCLLNYTFRALPTWQPIRLESLALSPSGHKIQGTVVVLNLAFQKEVSARFTLDNWKMVSEVAAEHLQSLYLNHSIVSDLFSFTIDKENLLLSTRNILHICVRYKVLEQESWDNNGGMNYQVTFTV